MATSRQLGDTGLTTPPLILGGNVFGWTADRSVSFSVLDAFIAAGGTMIDTADMYSVWAPGNVGGESESIIGEWLTSRGRRQDVLIATKVGMKPDGPGALTRQRIHTCVDASLQRLKTDYIDLYYAHRDDTQTPLEETLSAFEELVQSGKVRTIGASNYDAPRLAQAHSVSVERGIARYSVLQPNYSLVARKLFEGPVRDWCVEHGVAVVPYFPLAAGFLTGKYRSLADLEGRSRRAAVEKYVNDKGFAILASLDRVAAELHATLAQVALAWVIAQPGITAPIASATSVAQLEELVGAMSLVLSPQQLATLDAASA